MGSKGFSREKFITIQRCIFRHCKRKLIWWQMLCISRGVVGEPGELITKAVSDDKLCQLQMDVPMKCKKDNINFFLCLENQSDKNNVMPVRDMGYQRRQIYGADQGSERKPKTEGKGGKINTCVLLDMYEERGIEKGISQGISQGIEEINTLYHCLLADHRMKDIQKAIMDTEYQKGIAV